MCKMPTLQDRIVWVTGGRQRYWAGHCHRLCCGRRAGRPDGAAILCAGDRKRIGCRMALRLGRRLALPGASPYPEPRPTVG
jgi:hypothetical protein